MRKGLLYTCLGASLPFLSSCGGAALPGIQLGLGDSGSTFGFDSLPFEIRRADDSVTVSPNIALFTRQYFSPFNSIDVAGSGQMNSELQQGGYAKVNATVAWTHGRFTVKAWGSNLFNRKVYGYGLDLRGAGFPYNFLVPSTPRTWGGTVRVAF